MAVYSLRPLEAADETFSYQVYASTRLEEMALLDWSPGQKEAFLRMQFDLRTRQYLAGYPDAVTEIILCEGIPAGTMITVRKGDEIRLVDFALLPAFRGRGIGTAIVLDLQKECGKIVLHVLRLNPAASLYAKLGFLPVAEDAMYRRLEWSQP